MGEIKSMNSSSVDTTRPIDSVKSMVNKFGGVAGWKARKIMNSQGAETDQKEYGNIKEEIPIYKKKSEDIEIARKEVEEELENTKKSIEELKARLEKAEKERDEEAIKELKSLKEKIEILQCEYNLLVTDKEVTINKANEAMLYSQDAAKKVDDLTLELMSLKEVLKSMQETKLQQVKDELKEINDQLTLHSSAKNELEEAKTNIEKIKQEIELLKESYSFLKSQVEKEKEEIAALSNIDDLQKQVAQATQGANEAISIAKLAREELKNAKEVAENAKARLNDMELRLVAANEKGTLKKLEEAENELKEKKEALELAKNKAEKVNEEKIALEEELRLCQDESNRQRRRASDSVALSSLDINKPTKHVSSKSCPDIYGLETESKPKKKKSFFPRIAMLLTRKKAHSHK